MSVTARSVVCNLLLNQLFVLTQQGFQLSNSPGKAIRACAPKVLMSLDLSWTGLDLDLDWWLLG